MTIEQIDILLAAITLPEGWTVRKMKKGDGFLVQISFFARDNDDPTKIEEQRCRKWYISKHATATEVVRTIYKAGLVAVEHEYSETFRYHGIALFHPHRNIQELAEAFNKDVRG